MAVPYTFGSATSAIPLSQLDSNFATAITLGSTALTLGTTTTTVAGLTLTSPVISTISNTGTLTLPTSTDTLVGRATTDTLTNKSISGSTNTLTNIPNSSLTNTTVTIGSTSIALGGTATTVAGLTLTSPTMTTPILGTPTSGTLTNCTGYPTSALSGTINLTSQVTGTLPVANGGTGLTSFTANGVVYASSTSALATGSALQFDGTNLGLGVTPSAWASPVQTALQFKGGASFASWGSYGGAYTVANAFYNGTNWKYLANNLAGLYVNESGVHAWSTAASGTAGNAISWTQAMTLDNSGNLLVGTTSTLSSGAHSFQKNNVNGYVLALNNSGGTTNDSLLYMTSSGTGSGGYIMYAATGAGGGYYIRANGTTGTLSDRTIKENIVDATPKLEDLCKVQVKNYNLIGVPELKEIGVIAQQVQEVFPSLVEPVQSGKLSVKYSVFVPMLIKAIQELNTLVTAQAAEIQSLKAEVAKLKGV